MTIWYSQFSSLFICSDFCESIDKRSRQQITLTREIFYQLFTSAEIQYMWNFIHKNIKIRNSHNTKKVYSTTDANFIRIKFFNFHTLYAMWVNASKNSKQIQTTCNRFLCSKFYALHQNQINSQLNKFSQICKHSRLTTNNKNTVKKLYKLFKTSRQLWMFLLLAVGNYFSIIFSTFYSLENCTHFHNFLKHVKNSFFL